MRNVSRHEVQDWLEEWADHSESSGVDPFELVLFRDDNWSKDLARHILVKIRELGS